MSLVYDNMPEYSSDTESRHLKIMLQNIRIVLVETSHTGNMGSVARAMKTMGLTNLWLVNPLVKPDSQAIALAAGASDVIGNAQIVDTLDEAWPVAVWWWGPARAPVRCPGRCWTRANAA